MQCRRLVPDPRIAEPLLAVSFVSGQIINFTNEAAMYYTFQNIVVASLRLPISKLIGCVRRRNCVHIVRCQPADHYRVWMLQLQHL